MYLALLALLLMGLLGVDATSMGWSIALWVAIPAVAVLWHATKNLAAAEERGIGGLRDRD